MYKNFSNLLKQKRKKSDNHALLEQLLTRCAKLSPLSSQGLAPAFKAFMFVQACTTPWMLWVESVQKMCAVTLVCVISYVVTTKTHKSLSRERSRRQYDAARRSIWWLVNVSVALLYNTGLTLPTTNWLFWPSAGVVFFFIWLLCYSPKLKYGYFAPVQNQQAQVWP